jgi:nucleoside-diphosphate-sugar epimerase
MVGVYLHLIKKGTKLSGVFNAGFENISIIDIANRVVAHIPAEIIVSESNDPRSYRLYSQKLLDTGFQPKYCVDDAIKEVAEHFKSGKLKDEDRCYNIRTMKGLKLG